MNTTKRQSAGQSPYTAQNLDAAIAHLERAISSETAHSVFGQSYWRGRVVQIGTTLGLMYGQRKRLQRLLDLLENASNTAISRSPLSDNAPAGRLRV